MQRIVSLGTRLRAVDSVKESAISMSVNYWVLDTQGHCRRQNAAQLKPILWSFNGRSNTKLFGRKHTALSFNLYLWMWISDTEGMTRTLYDLVILTLTARLSVSHPYYLSFHRSVCVFLCSPYFIRSKWLVFGQTYCNWLLTWDRLYCHFASLGACESLFVNLQMPLSLKTLT